MTSISFGSSHTYKYTNVFQAANENVKFFNNFKLASIKRKKFLQTGGQSILQKLSVLRVIAQTRLCFRNRAEHDLSHFVQAFSRREARNPGLRQTTAKRSDVNSLTSVSVGVRICGTQTLTLNATV